ncbi:PREDICTED: uncharacterized protein LOC105461653, partial [Wasmannia auropunctata]|uniref:uncharacterized protein LOC105461653 n=1 Tax=Wasmannia auropunctata TaxID=64793 RepID=UPI0005F046F8
MEVLPGKQKDTVIYIYDGYVYYADSRYDNIFRCNTRRTTRCRGSAMLQDNNVQVLQEHNHQKTPFIKLQIEMKDEMLRLSRETCIGFKEIFDSVCRRNPNVAQYLSFPSIRCGMHRERVKSRPPVH